MTMANTNLFAVAEMQAKSAFNLGMSFEHFWAKYLVPHEVAGKTAPEIARLAAEREFEDSRTYEGGLAPRFCEWEGSFPEAPWAGAGDLVHVTGSRRMAWSVEPDGSVVIAVRRPGDDPARPALTAWWSPVGLSHRGPNRVEARPGAAFGMRHLAILGRALDALGDRGTAAGMIGPDLVAAASEEDAAAARRALREAEKAIGAARDAAALADAGWAAFWAYPHGCGETEDLESDGHGLPGLAAVAAAIAEASAAFSARRRGG